MRTSAGGGLVIAVLREGSGSQILSAPLHDFFDATISQGDLFESTELTQVTDAVANARSDGDRVRAIELFLLRRARAACNADRTIHEAIVQLRMQGSRSIGDMAASFDLSRDRFEKRFRRAIGTSARHYASLVRFERARSLSPRISSLAELAQAAGYYDQSHFNRDCRRLTGTSPSQFFGRSEFC
jgi:AraC-like DNA-binding protein